MPAISTDYITLAQVEIKAGGTKIDTDLQNHIMQLMVDSNRLLPDMFELHFHTENPDILDQSTFDIGKSIDITVKGTALFKGEVTALEPEFRQDGYVRLIVRGYDQSHRLHRGRMTQVFANMTDSAIVQKVVQTAGLTPSVDGTSTTHVHVWQNNQTPMEFIRDRAKRVGYQVYMDGASLCFKKNAPASGAPVELEWGLNLRNFQPKIAATHQSDKVTFQGWDPAQKKAVQGQANSATSTTHQGGTQKDGGAEAKKAFSKPAETRVINYPHITAGEAKTMAQALYDKIQDGFVQAEGRCIGNPKIAAGKVVKISNVGTRFTGTYVVTAAVHIFTSDRGYETTFYIHGLQPDVMAYLVENRRDSDNDRALMQGVATAIVTNSEDKEGLGRVKLKFPWLDEQLETDWVRVAAPGAGPTRGMYYIPEVNDEVLVSFEYGDINQPFILGGLWNKIDAPPKKTNEVVKSGKVNERVIRSRSGHVIILNDEQGKEHIIVRDKTENNEIIIDSQENTMTVNVQKDYALTAQDGNVSSTSGKDTEVTSGAKTNVTSKGNISVTSQAASTITIEAGGKVTVKGKGILIQSVTGNLDIKAPAGKISIQGLQVSIQATTQAELKGTAMVQIQGGLVKIN